MPFTVFMAICILGCDFLIYFLFQWTLGEKGRTKRRCTGSKRRIANGEETELILVRAHKENGRTRAKVLQYRKNESRQGSLTDQGSEPSDCVTEEMAHRRRAAAFGRLKQNPKIAV